MQQTVTPPSAASIRERRQLELESALEAATRSGDASAVERLIGGLDASALADSLEALEPAPRRQLWLQLPNRRLAEVLVEAHREVRQQLIDWVKDAAALAQAIAELDPDSLSDIDADLPPPLLAAALERMEPRRRQRFELLRGYPDDCAGGLMDSDPVAVRPLDTLAEATAALRRHRLLQGVLPEHLHALMVTDDGGRYLGMVELADLLVNDATRTVRSVMAERREPIAVDLPAAEVARRFEDDNLLSAAVVDRDGRLIGRITVDDVVDVIREQAERSQLANTGLDEATDTFAPALVAARRRAVWLGVNLCNAFLAAAIISLFETTIDQLVALAVLMPVVASMGGVAGMQSMALVIRAIALDQVHGAGRWRLLRREFAVGALNGGLWALVVAAVALAWFGNPALAAVFAAALVLNLLIGVFAGTGIPMLLNKFGVDPALAGGVVLVALTDAVGFGVFLGLGSLLLL